jgi:hypothetical protein
MKLYEISMELEKLCHKHDTGEMSEDDFMLCVKRLQKESKNSLSYLGRLIQNYKAEIDAYKAEEKRLKAKRVSRENIVKRIMNAVDEFLDGEEYADKTMKFAYHRCPPSVGITDEAAIPEAYYKIPAPVLDKRELLDSLKSGATVPGAELISDKRSLRLK